LRRRRRGLLMSSEIVVSFTFRKRLIRNRLQLLVEFFNLFLGYLNLNRTKQNAFHKFQLRITMKLIEK
jgi:hypothetical protein